jgi:gamma-butyrobetaine dioxygenase
VSEITAMMIDEAGSGSAVLARVSESGAAVVPLDRAWSTSPELLRESAASSPFAFAARLLGVEPLLVERQPIRPVPGGRSFASTSVDTPLHTDSQMFLGAPAAVQILVCVTPAPRGGESVLVDAQILLSRLEHEDPSLAAALFDVDRTQRFYFGDVTGPTVARRGGHLVWTVAPGRLGTEDDVGRGLAAAIAKERSIVHGLRPGEALVASNHRMLHGRRAFDGDRELVRLLVWLEAPLAADPRHIARARELTAPLDHVTAARLRSVLAILRGVPPAKVASDAKVTEPVLYGWRDSFVRGGVPALR